MAAGGGLMGPAAIVLAAGAGLRLRDRAAAKPLVLIGGRPLLLRVLDSIAAAGGRRAIVVTGHAGREVGDAVRNAPIPVTLVHHPGWASAPNGASLLAAAAHVDPGALLLMADHLVSPRLLARVQGAPPAPLVLGVDRRLGHPFVDEADVTRVRTRGSGPCRPIAGIGKELKVYDAYDTGVFRIGPELPEALSRLDAPGLSDGVADLAARGDALAIDVGDAPWLDVDDARALGLARDHWEVICR
jgi:choline kinase